MPNLNRRGPEGEGPMTGRKMGRCNPDNKGKTNEQIMQERGASNSTNTNQSQRLGEGLGNGLGRGLCKGLGRGLGQGLTGGRGRGLRGNQ